MRLKPKKIDINQEEPFENDLLDRKEYIENLLNLFNQSDDSLVLALIGKYGVGKTTLLKMLEYKAKLGNFKVIYFNAWESDYLEDPFSSILSEITTIFPENQDITNTLKRAGVNILKIGVPALIKASTMNLIDLSDATEEAISNFTSEFASAELEKHIQFKNSITDFKVKLRGVTEEIAKSGKQLLVIIDEIDRCKPTYSIKLLESIKHIFDLDNIHFLCAMDYSQLQKSVAHIYGNDTDSEGYLRRFFDFQIELPEPSLENYVNFLFESYELEGILDSRKAVNGNQDDRVDFSQSLSVFSKHYKASLRDIEKCFNIFSYVLSTTGKKYLIFPSVLAFIIVQYLFDKELYEKLINFRLDSKELVDYFYYNDDLYNQLNSFRDFNLKYFVGQIFITSRKMDDQTNVYDYFDSIIDGTNSDEEYVKYIKDVKEAAQHYRQGKRPANVMSYLDKKIQFIDTLKNDAI